MVVMMATLMMAMMGVGGGDDDDEGGGDVDDDADVDAHVDVDVDADVVERGTCFSSIEPIWGTWGCHDCFYSNFRQTISSQLPALSPIIATWR